MDLVKDVQLRDGEIEKVPIMGYIVSNEVKRNLLLNEGVILENLQECIRKLSKPLIKGKIIYVKHSLKNDYFMTINLSFGLLLDKDNRIVLSEVLA